MDVTSGSNQDDDGYTKQRLVSVSFVATHAQAMGTESARILPEIRVSTFTARNGRARLKHVAPTTNR
jgi:hypothetical protein